MPVPNCVGTYEATNAICNGDPLGATNEDRAPCAWRNRCAGLQKYCKNGNQNPSLVVASLQYPALVALCEQQIREHEIVDGHPGGPPPISIVLPPPPPRIVEPAAKPARSKKTSTKREPPQHVAAVVSAHALLKHFEILMRDTFTTRRFSVGDTVLVRPGTFYPIDRSEASRYISWYCVNGKGWDIALASVRLKSRMQRVDIQLPVVLSELQAFTKPHIFKKLNARDQPDGQFKILCRHLDREGIAFVVQALHKLVEADIVALP